jgi:hypothetical protein
MASEITYAEVRFKNESKSSDTNSPAGNKTFSGDLVNGGVIKEVGVYKQVLGGVNCCFPGGSVRETQASWQIELLTDNH